MKKPAGKETVRRAALMVAVTGSFATPFMASSVNVALPAIENHFGIDAVLLSWIATAYILASGVTLLPMGRLADIFGRKKILGLGFWMFAAGSLLCAVSGSAKMLIVFRVVQGIGSGMIFGTGMAILTSVYPPMERGRVLGIAVSAVYIGLTCGPFVGGMITQHLGWRALFLLNCVLGTMPLPLIYLKLKGEWADAAGEKFDLPGSVVYSVALVAVIYGFSRLPEPMGWLLLGVGLICFGLFVFRQIRIQDPLFDISLFMGNRGFAMSNLAALIHYSATFALTFILSLYLQYIKGLPPQSAGLVLMAQPIVMAVFSPLAGRWSDRIEPRIIASSGMFVSCAGLVLMASIGADTSLAYIIGYLFILGFGFAMFSSPNMNAILSFVERKHLGLASGAAATMRVLGQMFSMGIVTLIMSIMVGRQHIDASMFPNLLTSLRLTLLVFSGLCALGILASLVRGNIRGDAAIRNQS